jgi:threonine dehydrogenase-like Zn-dependent dehydrogenase
MKALVYQGPRKIAVEERPVPEIARDGVLVKVRASGICGSDIHGYLGGTGRRTPGYCMGHEFCGEIESFGEDVRGWSAGDRVVVQPSIFCGECVYCKEGITQLCLHKKFLGVFDVNGAMAEYVAVPAKLLYKMPDSMSFVDGALIEPLAVAKCAVDKLPGGVKGKNVLVVGVGTIGLLIISVLKARGAKTIIASDLSENRLNFAKSVGADYAFDPSKADVVAAIKEITNGLGADASLEAVGADRPVKTAIDCVRLGGDCVWVGNSKKEIVIDMQSVVTREITIYGTYTYSHEAFGETIYEMADMGIKTQELVGKCISIDEAPAVFEYLAAGNDDLIKAEIIF